MEGSVVIIQPLSYVGVAACLDGTHQLLNDLSGGSGAQHNNGVLILSQQLMQVSSLLFWGIHTTIFL